MAGVEGYIQKVVDELVKHGYDTKRMEITQGMDCLVRIISVDYAELEEDKLAEAQAKLQMSEDRNAILFMMQNEIQRKLDDLRERHRVDLQDLEKFRSKYLYAAAKLERETDPDWVRVRRDEVDWLCRNAVANFDCPKGLNPVHANCPQSNSENARNMGDCLKCHKEFLGINLTTPDKEQT